jgi:two-component sensor histidine kinase
MAMIHTMLNVSNDIEEVDVKAFIEQISDNLKSNYHQDVTIKLQIKKQKLSLNRIIPIGLIINELLTNSLKYAFKNSTNAQIIIVLKEYKGKSILTYNDNGSGLDIKHKNSMGLKLVELNVKQLKGSMKVINKNGLTYKIVCNRCDNV